MSDDRPHDPGAPEPANPPSGSSPFDQPSPWSKPAPETAPYGQPPAAPPPPPTPPYGAAPAYGAPPPGYGAVPPAPYGNGYEQNPESAKARSSATLWLILNIVAVVICANVLGIVGAIYAGLALGRADTDPADARRKVRTSKIWFIAGFVLALVVGVVLVIFFVVLAANSSSTSDVTFSTLGA